MAQFHYLAIDADGRNKRGGIEAANESAARALLVRRGLLPVEIGVRAGRVAVESSPRRVAAGRGKLPHKTRVLLTRQLATLVEASVPVDEALAMISAQQESALARHIIGDVQAGVVEGQRLAEALGRHPHSFSGLYRAAVLGGEQSGRLGFVLSRLADFQERSQAIRSKVTVAMIYPIALSLVAIIVVLCLMIFVVPSLVEQFERFGQRLPLITQALIFTSNALRSFWPLLLLAVVGGVFGARLALRQPHIRMAFDGALLRLPVIGRQIVAANASRFIRAVSTLVSSGLPVLESVRIARDSVSNRVAAAAVERMAERIEEGEPLSQAMRRSAVMPPMVCYMTQSGENSGELPAMLEKAAAHLDQETEAFTNSALSLLEPAVIIVMGVVVSSIVLAIMLPILQLNRLAIG